MNPARLARTLGGLMAALLLVGCDDEGGTAEVRLRNDFDNPTLDRQPPWTICESSYLGVDFGKLLLEEASSAQEVEAGLDYVLMVAAWDDPDCTAEHCLPLASRNEEEVVAGQSRTIELNAPNHQGPCPPEGIAPMPEVLYERVLQLWPEYGFVPYAQRTDLPQCQP
jgi:hypothetical protein